MSKETYESWSRAVSFALKAIGVLGIIFVAAFWAFTQRIELAFLPFFGAMAGVGLGMDTLKEITAARQTADPGPGGPAALPSATTPEPPTTEQQGGMSAPNEP